MEVFHCLFVGKGGAVDVPFSGRAVGWGNFFSGNTGKDGDQFVQADFCLGTEVVAGIGIWCGQCQSDAPGNVAGVDEVGRGPLVGAVVTAAVRASPSLGS